MINYYLIRDGRPTYSLYHGYWNFSFINWYPALDSMNYQSDGYIRTTFFRPPNRKRKEKLPLRSCENLQVSGSITFGKSSLGDIFVDPKGNAHVVKSHYTYLNLNSESFSVQANDGLTYWGRRTGRDDDGFWLKIAVQYTSPENGSSSYLPLEYYFSEEDHLLYENSTGMNDWIQFQYQDDAEKDIKCWLSYGNEQILYHSQGPFSVGEAIMSSPPANFPIVDISALDQDLLQSAPDTLINKAIENRRSADFFWFENLVGMAELPSALRGVVEAVASAMRKLPPLRMSLKALAGAYLIWIYAVKPTPEDAEIALERVKELMDPESNLGSRFTSRSRLDYFNGWKGWRQVLIQTYPPVTSVPVDLNAAFDQIEQPLRAGHSFALVPRVTSSEDVAAVADLLPFLPGDLAQEFWAMTSLSFVIDWFIGVDQTLEYVGNRQWLDLFATEFFADTAKAVKDLSEDIRNQPGFSELGENVSIFVRGVKYQRSYSGSVPDAAPLDLLHNPTDLSSIRLQGSALLVQRLL